MNDIIVSRIDKARTALAFCLSAPEAKKVVDMAHAAATYAKRQKMSEEVIVDAKKVGIEAMTLMGEFLAAAPKATAGRPHKIGSRKEPIVNSAATLAEVGITKKESSQSQFLAKTKKDNPKLYHEILEIKKTPTQARREIKEQQRENRREINRQKVAIAPTPDKAAEDAKFATIVIDPPWDWGDEGDKDQLGRAKPTYATMSIEQLLSLPVGKLADDDCHLYLWITNRSLPKGFQLLDAWGFRYITCLTWCKPSFGMGNYFRGQTEQILFAVKGSQPLKRKDVGTYFSAPRGKNGHSSKPEEFYNLAESCSPGPYLEMFSRSDRQGWLHWGEGS